MERKYETCIQSNLLEGRAGLFCEPSAWKFQNFLEISNKIDALNFFLNKFFSFIRKCKFEFILRDREILNNRLERDGGGTGDSSPSPATTSSPEIDVTHSRGAWLKNV